MTGYKDTAFSDFTASLTIHDDNLYRVETRQNLTDMATDVRATMDGRMAEGVARRTIQMLEQDAGMRSGDLQNFLKFMTADGEMQDRFLAWKAARRILG